VKIAFLITKADPIGGAQIHVRDLAVALQADGHGATVLTSGEGPFVDSLRAQRVPTIILRHLRGPIAPMHDVLALREIRAVLADVRPDLLAAHSSKAGILGRLAGRSLRMPVVFTAHGWAFTPGVPVPQAALYRRIERFIAPLASRIITVSEFDRRLALEARIAPSDRVVTVHNGMPEIPAGLQADPARTPPRLVMVARFQPQKDHATLLRALGGMRDRPWELDLIGNGPLAEDMQSLAASLGLDGRVHFLGRRTDVEQLLARAQISVLATNWEGFPLSILEAMRAGLPVVASEVGGISESVRDEETGYLVPRGDVDRLRDRIGRLLDAPALRARLGSEGRARFEQHFTLRASVDKTVAVYREVLAST
jgi:glycosyltransferase involved in cell wall biosynthesis